MPVLFHREAKDLTDNHFRLSLPIFRLLIESIEPNQIISLGTGNVKYLKRYFENDFKIGEPIHVLDTSHKIYSGTLLKYKFYNLPHPNARRLSDKTYDMLWKTLFSAENKNKLIL